MLQEISKWIEPGLWKQRKGVVFIIFILLTLLFLNYMINPSHLHPSLMFVNHKNKLTSSACKQGRSQYHALAYEETAAQRHKEADQRTPLVSGDGQRLGSVTAQVC